MRMSSLMVRYIVFCFMVLCGVAAQAATGQEAVDEVFFEKEMESRLTRDIRAYLGHDRFIIGVDFKASGPRGPGGEDNVIVREITTPLPGLPKASETFRKELSPEELNELNENLQLEEQVGSRSGLIDSESANAFTGSGTEVYLVLDTSVNAVQENFIRDLVTRKLALDVGGGDGIQVVRSDFSTGVSPLAPQTQQQSQQVQPQFQQPIFQPFPIQQPQPQFQQQQPGSVERQVAEETETPEEREERIANAIREAANQAAQAVSDANREALSVLQDDRGGFLEENWWVLVAAGLFLLLFFVLFAFLAMRRTPAYPQMPYMPMPAPAAPQASAGTAKEAVDEEAAERSGAGMANIRRELATVGLSAPHAVRSEMDSLMAQNRVDIIAPGYRVLGHNLYESLFGELPAEKQTEFNEYIAERDMSNTQIEAQAQDLYARLLRAASEDSDGSRSQAFRFLDKLHVSQILTLIKSEKARVQALVISQLQNQKASQVLQSLEAKQRTDVVHELSQFETFPVETFRDVASNLARKVQKIPAVENIDTDGVAILMNLLDNMTSLDEGRILSELENKNPDLYLKVKKQYFTFNDLASAPQKVLGEALLDVDKELVARALTGANDAITRRVLGSLPKRLADAVKEEMGLLKGKVSGEQVQADRKTILKIMRALVREGKIDMEKL